MNKEAIEEFKEIYQNEYGEEIGNEKAHELAQNLLNVYRIVFREPPGDRG